MSFDLKHSLASLTFRFENKSPVELSDLTTSLAAFGDEYRKFVDGNEDGVSDPTAKLYIKEIKDGSIIADLVPFVLGALQLPENYQIIFKYAEHFKTVVDWLLGESAAQPVKEVSKSTLENVSNVLELSAKDGGSVLHITGNNNRVNVVNYSISSKDANAAQNAARRRLQELQEPTTGFHEKVVLYWHRTTARADTSVGDRAVIESISRKPVKTEATVAIKAKLMWGEENPLKQAYLVDVAVETVRGAPVLYKIYRFHDIIPLEGSQ